METCPCCCKTVTVREMSTNFGGVLGIRQCAKCGAIFGTCYLGESYTLVLPYWAPENVTPEATRYFDFQTLGSKGIGRRHGWYDTATKRIVQTG